MHRKPPTDLLLKSYVFTNQVGVGLLDLLVGAGQLCLVDPQVLDQLARLQDGIFFLPQCFLQTVDVIRKAARASLFCLEVLMGLLLGLLRGTSGDFALQELPL